MTIVYWQALWVRPLGSWVLESGNVVAEALAVSLDKPLEWAVGFFFGNTELSLELWNVIAGVLGFDEWFFRMPSNRGRLGSIPFKTL